jgi:hypothetical protein
MPIRNSMRLLGDFGVALDHHPLNFNGAANRVDDTPELDNRAVSGAFDDPAVMHRDCWIDQVASERPQPRQNPVLVGAGKPRIAGDVGHQDRRELSGLGHGAPPAASTLPQTPWLSGVYLAASEERPLPSFVTVCSRSYEGVLRVASLFRARKGRMSIPPTAVLPETTFVGRYPPFVALQRQSYEQAVSFRRQPSAERVGCANSRLPELEDHLDRSIFSGEPSWPAPTLLRQTSYRKLCSRRKTVAGARDSLPLQIGKLDVNLKEGADARIRRKRRQRREPHRRFHFEKSERPLLCGDPHPLDTSGL